MFLRLIFKKLGIKENRFVMAATYGIIYALLFFLVLILSQTYLGRVDIIKDILFSLFVFIMMSIAYFIKWEVFKLGENKKD